MFSDLTMHRRHSAVRKLGCRAGSNRGVTVIEVMVAIATLAIGLTGIIAMQKVTAAANRDARNLEIANQISRTWIERLRADAMLWNHPSSINPGTDLTDTVWLNGHISDPTSPTWFRPVNATYHLYGVHDALGRDDQTANTDAKANGPFCVHLRLVQNTPKSVRVEVRVYWLRQGISISDTTQAVDSPLCAGAANVPAAIQNKTEIYHYVHATTEIVQNTAS
jgi:hypothetical protein